MVPHSEEVVGQVEKRYVMGRSLISLCPVKPVIWECLFGLTRIHCTPFSGPSEVWRHLSVIILAHLLVPELMLLFCALSRHQTCHHIMITGLKVSGVQWHRGFFTGLCKFVEFRKDTCLYPTSMLIYACFMIYDLYVYIFCSFFFLIRYSCCFIYDGGDMV